MKYDVVIQSLYGSVVTSTVEAPNEEEALARVVQYAQEHKLSLPLNPKAWSKVLPARKIT